MTVPTRYAALVGASLAAALAFAPAAGADARYIVQLDRADGAASAQRAEIDRDIAPEGADVVRSFDRALNAVVVTVPDGTKPADLAIDGATSISPDTIISVRATQTAAPWGLDRIDQPARPLDTQFNYTSTGLGVKAYVIDTGIATTNVDFGGRAVMGFDALGGTGQDCNGHGTHVAGTIGGALYGVAKEVALVGVRALDCAGSGPISSIIAGMDWVIRDHQPGQPAVANMSLGGGANTALDTAAKNLIADGVTLAVAAGNSAAEACTASPARVPAAITVAASDKNDKFASFSNRGSCVDIIAPGVSILSDAIASPTATATLSGTSMASPHVAGAAARILQTSPASSPTQVAAAVTGSAAAGKVSSVPQTCQFFIFNCKVTTPNRLLQASL